MMKKVKEVQREKYQKIKKFNKEYLVKVKKNIQGDKKRNIKNK